MASHLPWTIKAAMAVAIGGAVVTVALCMWVIVVLDLLTTVPNTGQEDRTNDAIYWLIVSLGLVLLNAGLLYAMSLRQRWAWSLTCALVIVGVIFDLIVFTPLAVRLGYSFLLLSPVWLLGSSAAVPWLWIHVALVEVPMLVLLFAPSSRAWFGVNKQTALGPAPRR